MTDLIVKGLIQRRDSLSRQAAQRLSEQDAKLRALVIEIERLRRELAFHDWLP